MNYKTVHQKHLGEPISPSFDLDGNQKKNRSPGDLLTDMTVGESTSVPPAVFRVRKSVGQASQINRHFMKQEGCGTI